MKRATITLLAYLIAASLQVGIVPVFAAGGSGNNNGNGNVGNGNGNGNSGNNNGNGNLGDLNGNDNFTDGNGNQNADDSFENGSARKMNFGESEGSPFAHFERFHGRFHHEGVSRNHRSAAH